MKVVLAMNLERLATLLEQVGDKHWSSWLRQDAADLKDGDTRGAQHFLSAFGGMGSIGDHYYCSSEKMESKTLTPDEQIGKDLTEAYSLACLIAGKR